jgi:hypothetical protein
VCEIKHQHLIRAALNPQTRNPPSVDRAALQDLTADVCATPSEVSGSYDKQIDAADLYAATGDLRLLVQVDIGGVWLNPKT